MPPTKQKSTKAKRRSPGGLPALEALAAAYPEAWVDHPWDHTVYKVKTKVFIFLGGEAGTTSVTVKLPESGAAALTLPFCEPTGYGMGKSGWVTASFPTGAALPLKLLAAWLDESYRAIAPKALVARLEAAPRGRSVRPSRARASR